MIIKQLIYSFCYLFTKLKWQIKLLNKLPSKAKIIVLKGIENEDLVVKILKQVDTIKEMELMLILRKFNNSNKNCSKLKSYLINVNNSSDPFSDKAKAVFIDKEGNFTTIDLSVC